MKERYRRDREVWVPDFSSEETEDAIIVKGERTTMTFGRNTCSVHRVVTRGLEFTPGGFPDARLTDEKGVEYRHRDAVDGNLKINSQLLDRHERENFVQFTGLVTPRSEDGRDCPVSFHYTFKIHKLSGSVLTYVQTISPFPYVRKGEGPAPELKVRKLVFAQRYGDKPEHAINAVKVEAWIHKNWKGILDRWGRHYGAGCIDVPERKEGTMYGATASHVNWSGIKCGYEVHMIDYRNCQIHECMLKDDHAYKYLAVGTFDGQRGTDFVPIHQPAGSEVTLSLGTDYKWSFSFLPFKKYRPDIQLYGGSDIHTDWSGDSIHRLHRISQQMARLGVTLKMLGGTSGVGAGPTPEVSNSRSLRKAKEYTAAYHHYGIYAFHWPQLPIQTDATFMRYGWYTREQVEASRLKDFVRYGKTNGYEPWTWPIAEGTGAIAVCMDGDPFRKVYLEKCLCGLWPEVETEGVYLDCAGAHKPCDNKLHGHHFQGSPVEGNIKLWDDFRNYRKTHDPNKFAFLHPDISYTNCQAGADYFLTGELFLPRIVPSRAEIDCNFTSLLYNNQCIYYTGGGGLGKDKVKTYELALGRCATINMNQYDEQFDMNPEAPECHFFPEELDMWVKYMTPLVIFDCNASEMHHRFDEDFSGYAKVSDITQRDPEVVEKEYGTYELKKTRPKFREGITPVIYALPDSLLVVVVKESLKEKTCDLTLNMTKLKLGRGNLLVFDTVASTLEEYPLAFGPGSTERPPTYRTLEREDIDVSAGPRIFCVRQKTSKPTVVWHDQIVWKIDASLESSTLSLAMTGVPDSTGKLFLFCARQGNPTAVAGAGRLASFDEESRLAVVAVDFDFHAKGAVEVRFSEE